MMRSPTIIYLSFLILPVVICHYHTGYFHEFTDPFDAKTDWMAGINDNTKLSKLSIPGTHDSASHRRAISNHDLVVQGYMETQCMNFDEQLRNGIRAFDIRVFNKNGFFQLTHSDRNTKETFSDFLQKCNDFLNSHQKEVLIMRLKIDQPTQGNKADGVVLDEYMKSALGRRLKKILSFEETIGEHRGMIILLPDSGSLRDPQKMTYWHCDIQDFWDIPTQFHLYDKWKMVKDQLIKTPKSQDCSINFLSGNNGLRSVWPWFVASGHVTALTSSDRLLTGSIGPPKDANRWPDFPRVGCVWFFWTQLCTIQYEGTNVLTTNFLNDQNNGLSNANGLGLVYSDYPGTGLISAIIARNFM